MSQIHPLYLGLIVVVFDPFTEFLNWNEKISSDGLG